MKQAWSKTHGSHVSPWRETRERTEGAATAEQAMRGDNFSARRVEPDPKTNSTSVGMMAEPPALLCRDDVLVENGDASPKSCLPFLEMYSPSAAGGLLPTGEAFTATRTTFKKPPLRFCSTEEMDSKTNWRTQILYVSYDSNFLPAACSFRMVMRQNREKIGCLIQAVLKVVSAPARFWDRGACCFVVRLFVLEQLGEASTLY